MDLGLASRVALVTGAARGLGRAEAEALGAEGARIAINDIDGPGAERAAEAIAAEHGIEAAAFPADVTDGAAVEAMVEAVAERLGRLDILVNNAGIAGAYVGATVEEMSPEHFDHMIATHLRSTYLCSHHAIPHLKREPGGRIVNTSSIMFTGGGRVGASNYAAAKAAIAGFTATLAKEVAGHGATANAIAPGYIETDIIAHFDEGRRRILTTQNPMGRLGRAHEVGALVAFLCSARASFINGALVAIDGGRQDYFWG